MSLPKRNSKGMFSQDPVEHTDILNVLNHFEELEPDYFYNSGHPSGDSFQNLSKSDYAKVIFCDLYYNSDSTVGCRFQITDNVHEDPCDYIGLFRVGYDNLSQCLASKMLSQTDCEDDGKLLRCTFKPSELPELENGFYQFLYVTRDKEVCGASMPFQIKNSITKGLCSDEDIVADNSEDDFLVVRSNMAEKNRRLQALLDEMTEKCLKHESEMRKIHEKLKIVNEEKIKIEHLLKKASDEKINLAKEAQKVKEEKNFMCQEKEEAIRILREKNKVFSSMFEDYSEKLKEFTELKDELLADKNRVLAENVKLQDRIRKLTEDMQNRQIVIDLEKEKKQTLTSKWKKEFSKLASELDDAKLMIEALEKNKQLTLDEITSLTQTVSKLQEYLKDAKCQNLVLGTKLSESAIALEKSEKEMQHMKSEITVLKLHIVDLHGSKSVPNVFEEAPLAASGVSSKISKENASEKEKEELCNLKAQYAKLESELKEKNDTILKLKEEIVKVNGVVEYLTKEKDSAQKDGSLMQDALGECILRLNEGSELYKKQFRKIEKLKKKMKKHQTKLMVKDSAKCIPEITNTSMKDSCSSAADSADETTNNVKLPQNQSSDSDTGEHVLRNPASDQKKRNSVEMIYEGKELLYPLSSIKTEVDLARHEIESLVGASGSDSSRKGREVPELQTLIEMNLEKFKNSQSKEDEVLYSIPCPVCDQDIGIYVSSTDEMIKHLEVQHKQRVCPVCGRLFDMNLPSKYFVYHVEDHFMAENKK